MTSLLPARRPARVRRPARRAAFGGLVAVAVAVAATSAPVEATVTERVRTRTYHPRPGLTLTTVRYGAGPVEVRVLEFTPKPTKDGYTVEPGAPGAVLSTHAKPSTMAANQGAIAAINGDFGHDGQPAHFNALDGDVRTSGLLGGAGFAITKNESVAYAHRPHRSIQLEASDGDAFRIESLNAGQPNNAEVGAFTQAGGKRQAPGQDMCYVRLLDPTARVWSNGARAGISRTYDVGQKVCQFSPLAVGSEQGTVLLTGRRGTAGGDLVDGLPKAGTATITWKLSGWPGIVEAIGGQPVIVDAGHNVGPPPATGSSYFYKPNPRSAIGITRGCTDDAGSTACRVIYMTVDGRRPGWSVGMTLNQLGAEMKKYDAYYAVNIDGGGGTTMWVKNKGPYCITDTNGGCLVNRPSDAVGERATLSAMMILPGRDTNEPPIGTRSGRVLPDVFGMASDDGSPDPEALALADPASTGGLLDALAEQGNLPPELRPALRTYRSSR